MVFKRTTVEDLESHLKPIYDAIQEKLGEIDKSFKERDTFVRPLATYTDFNIPGDPVLWTEYIEKHIKTNEESLDHFHKIYMMIWEEIVKYAHEYQRSFFEQEGIDWDYKKIIAGQFGNAEERNNK